MNNYFNDSFKHLILDEGGYANNPNDTGKETYLGVSIVHNPDLKMWPIIHSIIKKDGVSGINAKLKAIPAITAEVKKIYKQRYWDVMQLDQLSSKELTHQLFDHAVNAGVPAAIKLAYELVDLPISSRYSNALLEKLKQYGTA